MCVCGMRCPESRKWRKNPQSKAALKRNERVRERMMLPSAVPEKTSALKLLVLFFRRCFLRLACGDGGGSILGLVVLDILGLEQTESPRPVSTAEREREKPRKTPEERNVSGQISQAHTSTELAPKPVMCSRCMRRWGNISLDSVGIW